MRIRLRAAAPSLFALCLALAGSPAGADAIGAAGVADPAAGGAPLVLDSALRDYRPMREQALPWPDLFAPDGSFRDESALRQAERERMARQAASRTVSPPAAPQPDAVPARPVARRPAAGHAHHH